jgi:hypothetical protein
MAETKPLACSLDAAAARDRLALIESVGRRALLSREEREGMHLLRFAADAQTRAELRQIVRAERRCCPFLDLGLAAEDDEVVLTVGAGQDARDVATMLAEAFGPAAGAPAASDVGSPRPLWTGMGAGALAALLCCVVAPLFLGGIVGAAVGGVGDAVLAIGAVGIGAYAMRRRRRKRCAC